MTDKERLIKSLDGADLFLRNRANSKPAPLNEYDIENLLDIAKRCDEAARTLEKAIIPPCNVGDTLWILFTVEKTIESREIESIMQRQKSWTIRFTNGDCFTVWDNAENEYFGKTVFLTKEEAEAELRKRGKDNG